MRIARQQRCIDCHLQKVKKCNHDVAATGPHCVTQNPRLKSCLGCRLGNRGCKRSTDGDCDRCKKQGRPCVFTNVSTRNKAFQEYKDEVRSKVSACAGPSSSSTHTTGGHATQKTASRKLKPLKDEATRLPAVPIAPQDVFAAQQQLPLSTSSSSDFDMNAWLDSSLYIQPNGDFTSLGNDVFHQGSPDINPSPNPIAALESMLPPQDDPLNSLIMGSYASPSLMPVPSLINSSNDMFLSPELFGGMDVTALEQLYQLQTLASLSIPSPLMSPQALPNFSANDSQQLPFFSLLPGTFFN
ncbi:hypothetical protein BDR26DRAFT_870392, partial [Obelidium mucronatum]